MHLNNVNPMQLSSPSNNENSNWKGATSVVVAPNRTMMSNVGPMQEQISQEMQNNFEAGGS